MASRSEITRLGPLSAASLLYVVETISGTPMGPDYGEGFEKCEANALAHAGVAYQLRAAPETEGFAVAHAALAEEEAAKAAFCILVSKKCLEPRDVEDAFFRHPTKSWLYDALFRKKLLEPRISATTPQVLIGGVKLDRALLRKLANKNRVSALAEHEKDRNAGLYVNKVGDKWQEAGRGCSDEPKNLVYRYVQRARALLWFCDFVRGVSPRRTQLLNFQLRELASGAWRITYEEI